MYTYTERALENIDKKTFREAFAVVYKAHDWTFPMKDSDCLARQASKQHRDFPAYAAQSLLDSDVVLVNLE